MKENLIKIGIAVLVIIAIIGLVFAMKGKTKDENDFVVGLDDNFPPMGYRNEDNELVGFDIDLAKAVCEKMGKELKFQPISWASKEQELNSGNIDCIWSGLAYSKERAETMTLTTPYVNANIIFFLKNGSEVQNQEELRGKKIGVQAGSIQQMDLENSEIGKTMEIIQYTDYVTAFMDLETGSVDAIFAGEITGYYISNSKGKEYRTIPSQGIYKNNGNVVGFKQGNTQLRDEVQQALEEIKREGKLKEISERWFGKDLTYVEEK